MAISFATTHWTLVLAARHRDAPEAQAALTALCQSYWFPLYAFIRRHGYNADEAQDLTQEFFTRLLEKDFLDAVDRDKGRFRSFLLAACKHFLANERDRARAQKRGGGRQPLPLDLRDAEARFCHEPAHTLTAEKLFARRWALAMLDEVLARLQQEYAGKDKAELFEALRAYLIGDPDKAPYARAAEQLRLTEGAIKVAVHRLRQRYRELLREEIARTLDDPEQVDEEIRELFAALGS
jgi:RNA polymerase sigma-70 factor (ECF subfamily)